MSRYDGLIIPRSYNEYINKTDPVAMSQALQLSGVLSAIVAAGDNKAVKSSAVYEALTNYINKTDAATLQQALQLPGVLSGAVAAGDNKAVTSDAVNVELANYQKRITCTISSSKNYEMPIKQNYSSWIIGGMAQGMGAFSDFLNISASDINKNYGFVTLNYSASKKKLTLSSTSTSGSLITMLYLNGI